MKANRLTQRRWLSKVKSLDFIISIKSHTYEYTLCLNRPRWKHCIPLSCGATHKAEMNRTLHWRPSQLAAEAEEATSLISASPGAQDRNVNKLPLSDERILRDLAFGVNFVASREIRHDCVETSKSCYLMRKSDYTVVLGVNKWIFYNFPSKNART